MMRLIFAATLLISFSAGAADLPCTIHPKKGMIGVGLAKLVKLSREDAARTALKTFKISTLSIKDGELKSEDDCLIYSFDIQMTGKLSTNEVTVDAGNGKILPNNDKGPKVQAAEIAVDDCSKALVIPHAYIDMTYSN